MNTFQPERDRLAGFLWESIQEHGCGLDGVRCALDRLIVYHGRELMTVVDGMPGDALVSSAIEHPATVAKNTAGERFVSASCEGERCSMCGAPAEHKVGEEIPHDHPYPNGHNLTAYVCFEHFRQIVGPAAGPTDLERAKKILEGFLNCPEIAECAPEDKDPETRGLERLARKLISPAVPIEPETR